jgi:hypothetical protein
MDSKKGVQTPTLAYKLVWTGDLSCTTFVGVAGTKEKCEVAQSSTIYNRCILEGTKQ